MSLSRSCRGIEFGAVKIVTDNFPIHLSPKYISHEECPQLKNINDYNQYVFSELGKHVQTSHCLVVHADSYVIYPDLWDNNWLNFDYVAAPWQIKDDAYICHDTGEHVRVGNGGFSLRSKKLLDAPHVLGLPLKQEQNFFNEDGNVAVYNRVAMLNYGIKYAPVEVAAHFSFENPVPENYGLKTFGFHKNYPYWMEN